MRNKTRPKVVLLVFLLKINLPYFGQSPTQNIDLFAEYNVNGIMPNKDGTYSIYGYNKESKTRFLTRINKDLNQELYKQIETPGYQTTDLRSVDVLFEPKQQKYYIALWEYKRKPDEKPTDFGSIPIQPMVFVYNSRGEYIETISFKPYLNSTEKTRDKVKLCQNIEGDVYFFYNVEDSLNPSRFYLSAFHINPGKNRKEALFSVNLDGFDDLESFDICAAGKEKFFIRGKHSIFLLYRGQTWLGNPLYKFEEYQRDKYKSEILEKWCYSESSKKLFLLKVSHKQPDRYGQVYSSDHSLLKLTFNDKETSDLSLDKEIDLHSFKAFKRASGTIITKDVVAMELQDDNHIVMAIEKWTPTTTASKYHYSLVTYNTHTDRSDKESDLIQYLCIQGELSLEGGLAVNSKNDILFKSKIWNYKTDARYQHIYYWHTDSTLDVGMITNPIVKKEFERLQDNVASYNRRALFGSIAKDFIQAAPQALAAAYTVKMQNSNSQTSSSPSGNSTTANSSNVKSNSSSATSQEQVGSLLKSYSEALDVLNKNKSKLRYYDLEYDILTFLYGPKSNYNGGNVAISVCKDHVDQYNFYVIKLSWGVMQYLLSDEPEQIPSIENTIGETLKSAGEVHQHSRIGECGCSMCQRENIDWEKYYH